MSLKQNEPDPADIAADVAKAAINFAIGLQSQTDTDKFRAFTENGINQIEAGIASLHDEIAKFEALDALWHKWDEEGQPMTVILTNYTLFLDNPKSTEIDADAIDKAMMHMGVAVFSEEPVLKTFMDAYTNDNQATSLVENAYRYFSFLVQRLMQGYAILGVANPTYFERWTKWLLHGGGAEQVPSVQKPILKTWGTIANDVVSGAYNDITLSDMEWSGENDIHILSTTIRTTNSQSGQPTTAFLCNKSTTLPKGHVIVACDYFVDPNDNPGLVLWHGLLGKNGYVTGVDRIEQNGDFEPLMDDFGTGAITKAYNHNLIDNRRIEITDGSVIVGLKFALLPGQGTLDLTIVNQGENYKVLSLLVQSAPLNGAGEIDMSAAKWSSPPNVQNFSGTIPTANNEIQWSEAKKGFVAMPRSFTHWAGQGDGQASPNWNTPITGVNLFAREGNFKIAFRTTFHRNSFSIGS